MGAEYTNLGLTDLVRNLNLELDKNVFFSSHFPSQIPTTSPHFNITYLNSKSIQQFVTL